MKSENFDPSVFEKITGIDVGRKDCTPTEVEINGKKYRLIDES